MIVVLITTTLKKQNQIKDLKYAAKQNIHCQSQIFIKLQGIIHN